MNKLLHNMSCAPRHIVSIETFQIKVYYCFNPYSLAAMLGVKYAELTDAAKDYVKKHPEIANNVKKPIGYMIGRAIDQLRFQTMLKYEKSTFRYKECVDLELMLLVFGGTVGDLYIPNRPLSFDEEKFKQFLFFPKDEVEL